MFEASTAPWKSETCYRLKMSIGHFLVLAGYCPWAYTSQKPTVTTEAMTESGNINRKV